MYDKLTDIQLKEAIELLIKEKVISKELSETMLSADASCGVLTNQFGQPSVFLQEMLSLIGKGFLVVGNHYELGTYEGKYY